MTVLLVTIGSSGDVHPFVGLGIELKKRGHRVRVIVNPHYQKLMESVGLEIIPLGTAEEFERLRENPDLWHRTRGFPTIVNAIAQSYRPVYDAVVNNFVKGETVIAASTLAMGARVAQDKFDLPMATVHLSPSIIRSVIAPPKLPGLYMPDWMPIWLRKVLFAIGDKVVIDRLAGPALNAFRKEVGLPAVKGVVKWWWNSPKRVIGMFPDWFAPIQADWPVQTRLTGFPLYDERGVSDLSPQLQQFLDEGTPPIVFTPGTAMLHADKFFDESVKACKALGCRGILLSRHLDHIPDSLNDCIRHFDYAPFSQILPRAAAFVHHGGIGTSSQAMAAGVPQIVMPFTHDQLDNVDRMQRMRIARWIEPRNYKSKHIAATVSELLNNPATTAACKEITSRFRGVDAIGQTCDLIEQLRLS